MIVIVSITVMMVVVLLAANKQTHGKCGNDREK